MCWCVVDSWILFIILISTTLKKNLFSLWIMAMTNETPFVAHLQLIIFEHST